MVDKMGRCAMRDAKKEGRRRKEQEEEKTVQYH
jgi:hypothetical protein